MRNTTIIENMKIACKCGENCGGVKAYIKISYGPYISWGIVRHRAQRLRDLVEALEEMGHTVELIPTNFWDRVEIDICGRVIFRCRLTHLERNPISMKVNPVCRQAICAVIEALTRMKNAQIKKGIVYHRI